MSKKQYLLVAFLGLVLTTVIVSSTTLAFGGRRADDANNENRGQVQQAIENKDYTAWQTAMTTQVAEIRQRATDLEAKINQATFDKLTQAHQLMQDGKRDEAKAIFDEIGVFGPMGHMGKGMGFKGQGPAFGNTQNQAQ